MKKSNGHAGRRTGFCLKALTALCHLSSKSVSQQLFCSIYIFLKMSIDGNFLCVIVKNSIVVSVAEGVGFQWAGFRVAVFDLCQ